VEDVGFFDVVLYAIAGLIIGAIARMILPGRQTMGLLVTMLIGVVSAVVGGLIWNAIFEGNEGIAWIGSIVVAVVVVLVYERAVGSKTT
jgi:uncharacterized membrane protein YeaQ/YmgE (transglycosylase-associated protein family)